MLVGWAGAGSNRLKSMHLVLLVFMSSWRPRTECCMALKLVWRFVNSVQWRARYIKNGVVCVDLDQRITSSKSDIIWYIQRKESTWELNPDPHRDWRSGQQALRFGTLKFIWEVVGEPDEEVIRETKAVESTDKNMVIDRFESLGQVDENSCTVRVFFRWRLWYCLGPSACLRCTCDQLGNRMA
jgi:hypothetical protein